MSLARIMYLYILCVIKRGDKQDVDGYMLLHSVHAVERKHKMSGEVSCVRETSVKIHAGCFENSTPSGPEVLRVPCLGPSEWRPIPPS